MLRVYLIYPRIARAYFYTHLLHLKAPGRKTAPDTTLKKTKNELFSTPNLPGRTVSSFCASCEIFQQCAAICRPNILHKVLYLCRLNRTHHKGLCFTCTVLTERLVHIRWWTMSSQSVMLVWSSTIPYVYALSDIQHLGTVSAVWAIDAQYLRRWSDRCRPSFIEINIRIWFKLRSSPARWLTITVAFAGIYPGLIWGGFPPPHSTPKSLNPPVKFLAKIIFCLLFTIYYL